jgi:hypothetical protein
MRLPVRAPEEMVVYGPLFLYILPSPLLSRRGSLIGKAVVLKTTARRALAGSSPVLSASIILLNLPFGFGIYFPNPILFFCVDERIASILGAVLLPANSVLV